MLTTLLISVPVLLFGLYLLAVEVQTALDEKRRGPR